MADPQSAQDGLVWLIGGGGAGGAGIGGLTAYLLMRYKDGNGSARRICERLETMTTQSTAHHQRQVQLLERISESLTELNGFMRGVMSK